MMIYSRLSLSRRTLIQALALIYFFRNILASASGIDDPHKTSFECVSRDSTRTYQSVDEFWMAHQDPVAYELNSVFRRYGWLKQDASELSELRTSAILTKEYKNKIYHDLYQRMWAMIGDIETRRVLYVTLSQHLF